MLLCEETRMIGSCTTLVINVIPNLWSRTSMIYREHHSSALVSQIMLWLQGMRMLWSLPAESSQSAVGQLPVAARCAFLICFQFCTVSQTS